MDDRRKRILFRAWRRGFREIDLILGGFADKAVATMDEASLTAFEDVLNLNDQDVYEWVLGREPAPPHLVTLIAAIREISVPSARSE